MLLPPLLLFPLLPALTVSVYLRQPEHRSSDHLVHLISGIAHDEAGNVITTATNAQDNPDCVVFYQPTSDETCLAVANAYGGIPLSTVEANSLATSKTCQDVLLGYRICLEPTSISKTTSTTPSTTPPSPPTSSSSVITSSSKSRNGTSSVSRSSSRSSSGTVSTISMSTGPVRSKSSHSTSSPTSTRNATSSVSRSSSSSASPISMSTGPVRSGSSSSLVSSRSTTRTITSTKSSSSASATTVRTHSSRVSSMVHPTSGSGTRRMPSRSHSTVTDPGSRSMSRSRSTGVSSSFPATRSTGSISRSSTRSLTTDTCSHSKPSSSPVSPISLSTGPSRRATTSSSLTTIPCPTLSTSSSSRVSPTSLSTGRSPSGRSSSSSITTPPYPTRSSSSTAGPGTHSTHRSRPSVTTFSSRTQLTSTGVKHKSSSSGTSSPSTSSNGSISASSRSRPSSSASSSVSIGPVSTRSRPTSTHKTGVTTARSSSTNAQTTVSSISIGTVSSTSSTQQSSFAVSSAPVSTPSSSALNIYRPYLGNGSVEAGWPSMEQWVSFKYMFESNTPQMRAACAQWGVPNDSDQELAEMRAAIMNVGAATNIDPRFILAIVLQESTGCVRVITTAYSHANPGLMQSFNGTGSCNDNNAMLGLPGVNYTGIVQTPCPRSEINQMILDGTNGTVWGPGLVQDMAQQGHSDVSRWYRTARLYNGGSLEADGDLIGPCCTPSYASDIANRLTGWTTAPRNFPS